MRNKIIFTLFVTAIAVPALASLVTVWSTTGMGIAGNTGTTSGARFGVHANRTSHQGVLTVAGDFHLETSGTTPMDVRTPGKRLTMHVTGYDLGAVANMVHLSGPAVLRVPTTTGYQDYEGTASADLVSNRHPDETGDPDTLEVHFVPATSGGPTLDFSGTVMSGDITIGKTDSY
jgi:hypothetical protein